jgi:hypothetical protein
MAEHNNDHVTNLPKSPNPVLKTLNRLIGKWRMSGPEVDGQISYEWMEGGFFMIQRFDLKNFGNPHKGIEYSGFDEETQTIRSRLMGTDGSRFTYTYEMDEDTLFYWFGNKGTNWFSKGKFASDGRSIVGRWNMPNKDGTGGYNYTLTRIE